MAAPTVLIILADGFEEIEAVVPIDLLRRCGIEVTVASLAEGIHVTGRSGLVVHADIPLAGVLGRDFDCLLLPGGPGVSRLRADPRVGDLARRQLESGRWMAAICAAPLVLQDAGLLAGRRFTAHFSAASELPGIQTGPRVVADGKLLTSRGAGTAQDFALLIVEKLISLEAARETARSISA